MSEPNPNPQPAPPAPAPAPQPNPQPPPPAPAPAPVPPPPSPAPAPAPPALDDAKAPAWAKSLFEVVQQNNQVVQTLLGEKQQQEQDARLKRLAVNFSDYTDAARYLPPEVLNDPDDAKVTAALNQLLQTRSYLRKPVGGIEGGQPGNGGSGGSGAANGMNSFLRSLLGRPTQ